MRDISKMTDVIERGASAKWAWAEVYVSREAKTLEDWKQVSANRETLFLSYVM